MCGPTGGIMKGLKPEQMAAGLIGSKLLFGKKRDPLNNSNPMPNIGWDGRPNRGGGMS